VRLDVFLKVSRLCPRRTLAQELCDAGFVLLNGRPAKSGHTVKVGDELNIRRRDREIVARVLQAPENRNVSRSDADRLVDILSERVIGPLDD